MQTQSSRATSKRGVLRGPSCGLTVREMLAECHTPAPILPDRAAWFHERIADGLAQCDDDAAQLVRWEASTDAKLRPSPGFDFAAAHSKVRANRAKFHAAAACLDAKPRIVS